MNFVQIAEFDLVAKATERLNFREKKIFFTEAIRGMKLKLCLNVHDISLYINCIFIVVAQMLSLLWQLKVSIGKVEIGIYLCVTADILTKVLLKCFWSSPSLQKQTDFYRRHYELVSKFNVGLKTLLHQGLSEPEFYGDLVYKFKKIVGRVDFSDQFRKIIVRYKRIGYNINIMRQSACLVFNPITVNNFASLFNCTPVGRASDSMMAPT